MDAGSEVESRFGGGAGTPTFQLDLRNHCLLCLEEELPSKIYEMTRMNPKNITSFQPIIHYLTRTDPTGDKSAEECRLKGVPVLETVPSLCSKCYEVCGELYRLHIELLEIQVKIQRQTDTLTNFVKDTRRPGVDGKGQTRVVRFGKKFGRSKMSPQQIEATKKFVTKFHKQIIDRGQGDNRVIFPSHPPESKLQPRLQPTPVPVSTQPLIFPRLPVLIPVASSSSSSVNSQVGVPLRPKYPSIFKPVPSIVNHVQQEKQQRQPIVPHAKKSKANKMSSTQGTSSLQPKPTSFSRYMNNMVILPDTNVDRFEVEGEDDFREYEEGNASDDNDEKPDISGDAWKKPRVTTVEAYPLGNQ